MPRALKSEKRAYISLLFGFVLPFAIQYTLVSCLYPIPRQFFADGRVHVVTQTRDIWSLPALPGGVLPRGSASCGGSEPVNLINLRWSLLGHVYLSLALSVSVASTPVQIRSMCQSSNSPPHRHIVSGIGDRDSRQGSVLHIVPFFGITKAPVHQPVLAGGSKIGQ